MTFWCVTPEGASVLVKVQPKSRRPGLHGVAPALDGTRLRIAVSEAAEDGRANRAACALLAQALDVAASAVQVAAGAASREKKLRVAGDPGVLSGRLAAL